MRTVDDARRRGDPHAFRKAISVHYRRKDLLWVDHATLPRFKTHIDSYGVKGGDDAAPLSNEERAKQAKMGRAGFRAATRDVAL